ncbi:MAG: VCBS repeat-containing protein, partial [Deltaproteobacteria bacterium]|nr:VCBS repeat-containing protein [Deltaproteobacteria bacterium]
MRIVFVMMMVALLAAALASCGGDDKKPDEPAGDDGEPTTPEAETGKPSVPDEATEFVGKPGRTLLVTQSRFKADKKGKYTVPEAGVLLLLTPAKGKWKVEQIVDTESNVYHKALQYGDDGILTLGANEAKLKLWKKDGGEWKAETLWHPTFGGKHNRLRDAELADFDGDGRDDLAIATHDQGVIAVVWRKESGWEAQELDRKADTFVHEIEVGDLDGDGKLEFYSTPSLPNTASGVKQ